MSHSQQSRPPHPAPKATPGPVIQSGSRYPAVHTRVLTLSEIQLLQKQLHNLEEEVLRREENCRVCKRKFLFGAKEVSRSFSAKSYR